jgi:putative flippase GtrA
MKHLVSHPKVRKHFKQGLKFCIAGAIGATIEFSVISVLVQQYNVPAQIAFLPSGLASLVFVFFFNKYITFGNREKKAAKQSLKFIIVYSMAFVINYSLASGLYFVGKQTLPLSELNIALLAKAVAIGITAFWNYFFSSGFIFKQSKPTRSEAEFAMSASV